MTRIKYEDWNPKGQSLDIVRAANAEVQNLFAES